MPVTVSGLLVALALGLGLGPRLGDAPAWWLPLVLALAGAVLGFGGLLFALAGSSYSETVLMTIGSGAVSETTSTRSLLDVGLQPLTAAVIALDALGFGAVLFGAFMRFRSSHPGARRLMLIGIVPPLVIGLISFGLATAVPGVMLSLAATILAFTTRASSAARA